MTVRIKPVSTTLTEAEFGRVALVAEKLDIPLCDAVRLLVLDALGMADEERLPYGWVNDVSIEELPIHGHTRAFLEKAGITMVSQVLLLMDRPDELLKIPRIGKKRARDLLRALGRPPPEYADQFR